MRIFIIVGLFIVIGATWGATNFARPYWVPFYQKLIGKDSVADISEKYGKTVQERLKPFFEKASISYPPDSITLLAIKDQKLLELWAHQNGKSAFIRSYPIKAASGDLGPKLREGDRQVPEGIYRLEYLNPNSLYHLSMKLNYPNEFDLKYAKIEGRAAPGTNIFIHGKAVSIGCLAMGNSAIEELFELTASIGLTNVDVAIAPSDPRAGDIIQLAVDQPDWVSELYKNITRYFSGYILTSS